MRVTAMLSHGSLNVVNNLPGPCMVLSRSKTNTSVPSREAAANQAYTVLGLRAEAATVSPGLHVVSTPIGNLADMSLRALSTLAAADAVIAEDTRVTKVLLAHYGIATPLIAYHEHNAAQMRPHILARLAQGAALALVSDAGTPLVSDPGFKLVEAAIAEGHAVHAVPGSSAVLAGLVVSGLPSDRFFFEGFLPGKTAARRARLKELATIPATLVFFESPRRIAETLSDALLVLGDRPASVSRELTKRFEETRRGSLSELVAQYRDAPAPKGEIVLLLGPPRQTDDNQAMSEAALVSRLRDELRTHSLKEAVARVCAETGEARKRIYALALSLERDA